MDVRLLGWRYAFVDFGSVQVDVITYTDLERGVQSDDHRA